MPVYRVEQYQPFRMFRIQIIIALFVITAATASAQDESRPYRGFLPPLFRLPSSGETVHFTSPQLPRFQTMEYPDAHKKSQIEGVVEIELYVTSEGEVARAEVSVGSGDELFDNSALKSAMLAHFPAGYATVDGQARDFKVAVPFYFLLSPDPEAYWHTRLELARIQQYYEVVIKEFQGYLSERTKASKATIEAAQKQVEEAISAAKKLHALLAAKKETAILRLREEIDLTRRAMEEPRMAASVNGRNIQPEQATPAVSATGYMTGVVSYHSLSNNDLGRLLNELELKKSYL